MDSESGDGLMDGLCRCSRETPDGMDYRDESILAGVSGASFSARGTWRNSQASKDPDSFWTRKR